MHAAILLAGGKGQRMGPSIQDKLLYPIGSSNAFRLSCEAFLKATCIDTFIIVYRDLSQKEELKDEFAVASENIGCRTDPVMVKGGDERKDSVSNALAACDQTCRFVHVHDCARPMIRPETINQLADRVAQTGAVAIARPMKDSVKKALVSSLGFDAPQRTESIDRSSLWLMETPQVTRKEWLDQGLRKAEQLGLIVTDEFSALELDDRKVSFLDPEYPNPKITTNSDLAYVEYLLNLNQ
jgi:2-C-methyl-D-erythritol 4-phosphate cytidylyltransferase